MSGVEAVFSLVASGGSFGTVFFVLASFLSFKINNIGVVDIIWSGSIGVMALFQFCLALSRSPEGLAGWRQHPALPMVLVVVAWSTRLAVYIGARLVRDHPREDPRFLVIRKLYSSTYPGILAFFLIQAAVAAVLTVPVVAVIVHATPTFTPNPFLFPTCCSVVLEALSDHQLRVHKLNHGHTTCRTGLWRYSRHPNYFFEAVSWTGFALVALWAAPSMPTVVAVMVSMCPVLMLWLLLRVTGVPLTERQALRSKGKEYAEYVRVTSRFIPWRPKD